MASGHTVANNEHLIHTDIWSKQLRKNLTDDLFALRFVNVLTEFPHGTTFHIPSLGEAETNDFAEGQAIRYTKLDTGDFTFEFDQYVYSAHSISAKFQRDSFYADRVIAAFVPEQHRAIMKRVEARIFNRFNAGQTASDLNTINEAAHRWVGSGPNESIAIEDFFRARYALTKANVPLNNLVAILDPTTAFTLETQANTMNLLSPMPIAANMVENGLVSGFQFRYSFAGFDVYQSNYLPRAIAETIDGRTTTTGVANLFFNATPGDMAPIIGGFRQMPTVQHEWNKDLQQDEYLTIAEFGFAMSRPENAVVVLTDTDVV